MQMKPQWDKVHHQWVIPTKCPVCIKCWLIVKGPLAGRCVHKVCGETEGYGGYREVGE